MIGFLDEGVDLDFVLLVFVFGVFWFFVLLAFVFGVIGFFGFFFVGIVIVCDWSLEIFLCGGLCRFLA